ncbi:hypothetical protein GGX14DRAFT_450302 [Mycena pura]|uniref:Uncharacterized protein n=1 Tax=Mycena pura TaxID=153505 RepID=A0AAD6VFV6_9AGAR|nr:hypothetical protein GGX14DRAFT_450302 [Mycena pura]
MHSLNTCHRSSNHTNAASPILFKLSSTHIPSSHLLQCFLAGGPLTRIYTSHWHTLNLVLDFVLQTDAPRDAGILGGDIVSEVRRQSQSALNGAISVSARNTVLLTTHAHGPKCALNVTFLLTKRVGALSAEADNPCAHDFVVLRVSGAIKLAFQLSVLQIS